MLLKQLFQSDDYRKTLKRRLWIFGGMFLLGVASIVLSLTVMPASNFSDHVQGFYAGAGSGLAVVSILFIFKNLRLLKNPTAAKLAQISETDEREKAIVNASMVTVFWAVYVVMMVGLFISFPLNQTVFFTLFFLMMVITATLFLSMLWHKKHM